MSKPVHKFLTRFDLNVWVLIVQRAREKKWSINKTINEGMKDVTDE